MGKGGNVENVEKIRRKLEKCRDCIFAMKYCWENVEICCKNGESAGKIEIVEKIEKA